MLKLKYFSDFVNEALKTKEIDSNNVKEDSAFGPGMMFGIPGPGPKKDRKPIPSKKKFAKGKEPKEMKNILTFEQFIGESKAINEIKGSFTATAKADKIIQSVDAAIKGGLFFSADLGNKVYMKEGGKRPVVAEKWRKPTILSANHQLKDLGREIEFEYDYTTFTTDKRNVKELSAKDYLEYRLGLIFNQMHTNTDQDWSRGAEAEAAGTYAFKPADNVTPYVDCGLIVWFADKYKIDLKKFMHDQHYTLPYDDVIIYSEKYPFKK